jgi:hypothetical protein
MLIMVPTCSIDRSTLESRISSLESCADSLDAWLSLWIALVVVGLFLEIAVIIFDHVGDWKSWKRALIVPPEKPTIPRLLFHLSGASLIALGVAGEFAVHTKVVEVQGELRTANHELVAAKDRETRSSIANTSSLTEKLRQENLNLQLQLVGMREWRSIKDRGRAIRKLPPHAGTPVVFRVFQNAESMTLLNVIVDILYSAQWKQVPISAAIEVATAHGAAGITAVSGIHIVVSPESPELLPPARALSEALKSEGINAVVDSIPPTLQRELMHVLIGQKPL